MIFEHYAASPLTLDRTRDYGQDQRIHHKPRGFWLSVVGEDDWPSWVKDNDFHPEGFTVRHEVTLVPDANILFLETPSAILRFHEKYSSSLTPDSPSWATEYIDWRRVTADYDGIVIAPYQWSLRDDQRCFWYYAWDVASGCIWNLDAIESVVPA